MFSSEEMGISNFSSDMEDIQSISLEEENDYLSSRKKVKENVKKMPTSTKVPCRKSPRGHGPKTVG